MTIPTWAASVLLGFGLAQFAAFFWAFVKWQSGVDEWKRDIGTLSLKLTQCLEILNRNNLDVLAERVNRLAEQSGKHTEGHKANRQRAEDALKVATSALEIVKELKADLRESSGGTNPRYNPPPGDGR
mgnify:CR=1 FL=1